MLALLLLYCTCVDVLYIYMYIVHALYMYATSGRTAVHEVSGTVKRQNSLAVLIMAYYGNIYVYMHGHLHTHIAIVRTVKV